MKLEAIRALCDAATPGPWERSAGTAVLAGTYRVCEVSGGPDRRWDDQAFIATARTLMPLLVNVAEAATYLARQTGGLRINRALAALEAADV